MATIDQIYEHFQTTYLEKYKSRLSQINMQLLLYTVARGDERMLQKIIFASVREKIQMFNKIQPNYKFKHMMHKL